MEQQNDGQLQQLDDSMYGADDSYEDYGGYHANQGYEAAGGMVDQDMDQLKGDIKDPKDLLQFLTRNSDNIPTCGICFKFSNKTTTCVKNHIEAIHFPNHFMYSCPQCNKEFNSKKSLYNHKGRVHN